MNAASQENDVIAAVQSRFVDVPGELEELFIRLPSSSGRWNLVFQDEYARERFAYWKLSHTGHLGGGTYGVFSQEEAIGCQHAPTVEDKQNRGYRNHWSSRDNEDNAAGNAFVDFWLEIDAPELAGMMHSFQFHRHLKYFYSVRYVDGERPWPGSGRYDRSRNLGIIIIGE